MGIGGDMPTAALLHSELRFRVQRRIDDGRLPAEPDSQIDAFYGDGEVCCACDQPITRYQVKYNSVDPRTAHCLCFHLSCHAIWQRECKHRVVDAKRRDTVKLPGPGDAPFCTIWGA